MTERAASWLAIDFGTCFSCAMWSVGGHLKTLRDPVEHSDSIPSSVLLTPHDEIIVGHAAEYGRRRWPDRYQSEFKRQLGEDVPLRMGTREYAPQELVTLVLEFLKRQAEGAGEPVSTVILTVPSSYEQHRRDLMRLAAKRAGFEEVELLEEPVAAALAPQDDGADGERLELVYDLGGGTFDAALVRLDGSEARVLGHTGHQAIGGLNFDRAIERDFRARAGDALQRGMVVASTTASDQALAKREVELEARKFCRHVKHLLSQHEHFDGELLLNGHVVPFSLSSERLAELTLRDVDTTIEYCRELVERSGARVEEVTEVLMVGGSSRLPFIQRRLEERLVPRVRRVGDPELAVCRGAALGRMRVAAVAPEPVPRNRQRPKVDPNLPPTEWD